MTFQELYKKLTQDVAQDKPIEYSGIDYDKNQMECLLNPDKHAMVWKTGACSCSDKSCVSSCLFHAIEINDGVISFNSANCTGCNECVIACKNHSLEPSHDTIKAINILKESEEVYALMAPAFVGQFGKEATPSKIRTALKQIGFAGMMEVATFADILTLKESLEFKKNEECNNRFQLTSCCCPIWISLIKKNYADIVDHLPPSVSPMIAGGRIVKQLNPGCKTIFIGPCMAKKAESKEPELLGAIDSVLTFQEMNDIFEAFKVDFTKLEDDAKEHSSTAGRLYARSGGVSEAVSCAADRLQVKGELSPVYANGIKECKELLSSIMKNEIKGNFYEGMGCVGGCVGGPKRMIDVEQGREFVNEYSEKALYKTPLDNPYVIEIIHRLHFDTVDDFLQHGDILNRKF